MDADSQSIERIKSAMQVFHGQQLQVTVFAPPLRSQNKTWRNLFETKRVHFQPVGRVGGTLDPTDEAIKTKAAELAKHRGVRCIALLTCDTGYVELARKARLAGKEVVVLMSKYRSASARPVYEAERAKVVGLDSSHEVFQRVQAVLKADGSGSVSFLKQPFLAGEHFQELANIKSFLQRWHFARDTDISLVAPIAKFWQQHSLGSLPVFPDILAWENMRKLISNKGHTWQQYHPDLAFVLPMKGGKATLSGYNLKTYGHVSAKRVFRGGGPFMLPDSQNLTMQALTRLGFLDDSLNADLAEGLMVFANNPMNKRNLRKSMSLPEHADSCQDIILKVRHALLSGAGQWEVAPSDKNVKKMLLTLKLLDSEEDPPEQVFEAMKAYAQREELPSMKTYNGHIWQILHQRSAHHPDRRDVFLGLKACCL